MGLNISQYIGKILLSNMPLGELNYSKKEVFAFIDKWKKKRYYSNTLVHMGKKGMKWGVQNGPPYPLKGSQLDYYKDIVTPTKTISGHESTPKKADPNDIIDKKRPDGSIATRTTYDESGMKKSEIHTDAHSKHKEGQFGEHGEHAHDYEWNEDGSLKERTTRNLTEEERKENKDIL